MNKREKERTETSRNEDGFNVDLVWFLLCRWHSKLAHNAPRKEKSRRPVSLLQNGEVYININFPALFIPRWVFIIRPTAPVKVTLCYSA